MAEYSSFWGGTTTGDAGPYTDDQFSDVFTKLFLSDRSTQGVLLNVGGELKITNPSGLNFSVSTGAAVVDGKIYESTSTVGFVGSAPVSGYNYYRIVLRKDFAAQTVRQAMTGPDVSAPISLVQNDGTTWEISLGTIRVSSTNFVTITDTRSFCVFNTYATPAPASILGSMIAPDTITDSLLQYGKISNRQGRAYSEGEDLNWANSGVTNYVPASAKIQIGSAETNVWGGVSVTFPVPFSGTPIFVFSSASSARIVAIAPDMASVETFNSVTGLAAGPIAVFWIAIGPP